MKIDVVTTEEIVYSGDVDIVIAPGSDGQLGLLPRHAALLTSIEAGLVHKKPGQQCRPCKREIHARNILIL